MSTQTVIVENADDLSGHEIVSREEWLIARKDLLKREKEFTRLRDQLAAERRALPWVEIEKKYVFDTLEGEATLADLFDGRSQLFTRNSITTSTSPGLDYGSIVEVRPVGEISSVKQRAEEYSKAAVAGGGATA